jgi:HlyD family secretion protein
VRQFIILLSVCAILLAIGGAYLFFKRRAPITEVILFGNVNVRLVDIGFRVYGKIMSMPWQEGQFVAAGTLLATLDKQPYTDIVQQRKAAIQAVQVNIDNAKRLVKRREANVSQGVVSIEDYENNKASLAVLEANLEQAKAALGVALTDVENTQVFAPVDATVLTRIQEPGAIINVSSPVYTLSVINPIWVEAFAQESELHFLSLGMPASIYTDTSGGKVYHAHLGFISPVAEFTPKTIATTHLRTDLVYRLRLYIDDPDKFLRQGMPVTAHIPLQAKQ